MDLIKKVSKPNIHEFSKPEKFGSAIKLQPTTLPKKGPPTVLRRRSKSLSDLRRFQLKPLISNVKSLRTTHKPTFIKMRHNGPSVQKNEATVPKKKIPDWDYKSRFHELQQEHVLVEEEKKQMKSNLSKFKEEIETLHKENLLKTQEIKVLKGKETTILQEKENLEKENCDLKCSFLKQDAYRVLQDSHEALAMKINDLEKTVTNFSLKTIIFENKFESQEMLLQQLEQSLEGNENRRKKKLVTYEEIVKEFCSMFLPMGTRLEVSRWQKIIETVNDSKREFTNGKIFSPGVNQIRVLEELSQSMLLALNGHHICVFLSKEDSLDDSGNIPHIIGCIFEKIKEVTFSNWVYTVNAGFFEMCDDKIGDLLKPEGWCVSVTDLKMVPVASAAELKQLMDEAFNNRAIKNENSIFTSYSITKICFEGYNKLNDRRNFGSLHVVDLDRAKNAILVLRC